MAEDSVTTTGIARHGAPRLPSVEVDSFNVELKDDEGFLGDRASKGAFREILDGLRKPLKKSGDDPLGKKSTDEIPKSDLDDVLVGDDIAAAALVHGAIEEFAQELAYVTGRFLKTKAWANTERIVVGGGFRQSRVGEIAIARTDIILKAEGFGVDLVPIRFHSDEAGLIGTLHSRSTSAAPISAVAWWRHARRRHPISPKPRYGSPNCGGTPTMSRRAKAR